MQHTGGSDRLFRVVDGDATVAYSPRKGLRIGGDVVIPPKNHFHEEEKDLPPEVRARRAEVRMSVNGILDRLESCSAINAGMEPSSICSTVDRHLREALDLNPRQIQVACQFGVVGCAVHDLTIYRELKEPAPIRHPMNI